MGAVAREWEYPISREALILADLYDLLRLVNSDPKKKAPDRYPRPWKTVDESKRTAKPSLPQAEVLAALRYMGHDV